MEPTVYVLDKPLNENWTSEDIDDLVSRYGVEIETMSAKPFRVVAMNAPSDGKPIHLTWRAECTLHESPYSLRFADDNAFPGLVRCFDGMPGQMIPNIIRRMVDLATGRAGMVVGELNGIEVVVKSGDEASERWLWMQEERERKHQAYLASPECKESNRLSDIEAKKRKAEFQEMFAVAPKHMKLKDEAAWKKSCEANQDSYGNAVMIYAEKWACFMESQIAIGKTVPECSDKCSHLADEEGITGFMYGCAVSILAQVWAHGEELRRWHNKDTQIGTEGDKANERGGVLNPALLSIG